MSNRVSWNQYEAVLLVDTYVKVRSGVLERNDAVVQLSKSLREYGKANGIEIDDVYRNTNGINMRLSEIERLFNDGKGGLKNTSKLFIETVELYNSDKARFDALLVEARRMTNRMSFLEWLKAQPKLKTSPEKIVALIEEGSTYAVEHKVSKVMFWNIDDAKEFDMACRKLLSAHLFRVIHRSTALALDKCYIYYKNYLLEKAKIAQESIKTIADDNSSVATEAKEEPVVERRNEADSSKELPNTQADTDNTKADNQEILNDTESLSDRLYELLKSISDGSAYGTTLYYLANSVKTPETVVKSILNEAEWASLQYGRYSFNYAAIQNEMKYNFEKPQSLAYTRPVSVTYFEDTVIRAGTWRQIFLDFMKVIYEDYPHYILQIKGKVYAGAALPIIADAVGAENMRAPKEFADGLFVETNRSADDIMANLKKILEACYVDYENVVITYESKSASAGTTKETAEVSNKSDVSSKNITIVEAVSIVLQKARKPWTAKEIYDQIMADKLYTFGAQHPIHVVEVRINAACKGSNYSYKAPQELFGFIREDGAKKYYILSREKEMVKTTGEETMSFSQSSEIRTETDSKLAEKYPVLFKRIYSTMKEYGNVSVSAQDVLDKVGKIARLSTVKRVLDYASWSERVGSNYRYSAVPINYALPEGQPETQPTISNENEFYHWLETSNGLSYADCSRYTSGINVISRFLNNECHESVDIYTVQESAKISEYFITVENHSAFKELAQNQKYRLSESMRLYRAYLAALEGAKNKEASSAARAKEKDFRQWAALNLCDVSTKKIEIQYLGREKSLPSGEAKKVMLDPQQMSKLMSFIKAADDGVSFNDIRAKFPGVKPGTLKAMLDTENAILMNGKYYHKNNIEDFEETADIILATVQNQFQRNAGYTSAKMLYDELHVRLEDFFFDNGGFDSSVELYDLTKHLFEKIKYKGNSYIFADNKHIWKNEPDYIKTYLGILSNWAKQQNNIMTRNEMIEKLIAMGSASPTATFSHLMINENQNPSEKMFLMYDEYRYVLTEACHIDESFISSLRMNLEELFEGDDYLAFDEIDEYFYTTLPELPSGVNWSAHMIKSVLTFFDVGFFTVAVGGDNDIKIPDAAIVRKNSMYKSFSDVLWSEINKDYELPKEFSSEDFREILLRKGFIHGMEKLHSVHNTVEGDLRYFWTENNSKVTVSKK